MLVGSYFSALAMTCRPDRIVIERNLCRPIPITAPRRTSSCPVLAVEIAWRVPWPSTRRSNSAKNFSGYSFAFRVDLSKSKQL